MKPFKFQIQGIDKSLGREKPDSRKKKTVFIGSKAEIVREFNQEWNFDLTEEEVVSGKIFEGEHLSVSSFQLLNSEAFCISVWRKSQIV